MYNEGVGIPITKYQSTERSYCLQLWGTTGIKNIKTKCTRTIDKKLYSNEGVDSGHSSVSAAPYLK